MTQMETGRGLQFLAHGRSGQKPFFQVYLCIYFKIRITKRERNSQFTGSNSNGHHGRHWAQVKSGVQNSIQCEGQGTVHLMLSSVTWRRSRIGHATAELEPQHVRSAGIAAGSHSIIPQSQHSLFPFLSISVLAMSASWIQMCNFLFMVV